MFMASCVVGKQTLCARGENIDEVLKDIKEMLSDIGVDASKALAKWNKLLT